MPAGWGPTTLFQAISDPLLISLYSVSRAGNNTYYFCFPVTAEQAALCTNVLFIFTQHSSGCGMPVNIAQLWASADFI